MEDYNNTTTAGQGEKEPKIGRRDLIKGLATLPIVGAFAYSAYKKKSYDNLLNQNLRQVVDLSHQSPAFFETQHKTPAIRLGIIGYGIRGEQLLRAAGFAQPSLIEEWKKGSQVEPIKGSSQAEAATVRSQAEMSKARLETFLSQEDLNIKVTAVCDIFDFNAERALSAAANVNREGTDGSFNQTAKRYRNYKELLGSGEVDAIIIATPDHWHTEIAIEAARRGIHIYAEKCLTHSAEETFRYRDAVKNADVIFQLGHQGRQNESNMKAHEVISKGVIGKVNLIEVCTNRNSFNGAWIYKIHPDGNHQTIDWEQFEAPCQTKHPFSPERFFRWRCWWDYSTGLAGDLLTHEYDSINHIMGLGIPYSAVSSGGVYFYKDKSAGHYIEEVREVPDVWQVALEYPERDLTMLYSASQANGKARPKTIMGSDGYLDIKDSLSVYADRESIKYKEKIVSGIINPELPIFTYTPGKDNTDAVSSATEKYFASRGLLYTYRGGKRIDITYLHVKEWIDCIRERMAGNIRIQCSCNIDQAFEEAITAHMATIAYRENRKVYWDKDNEKII
jgi:predicted dehydrogenase